MRVKGLHIHPIEKMTFRDQFSDKQIEQMQSNADKVLIAVELHDNKFRHNRKCKCKTCDKYYVDEGNGNKRWFCKRLVASRHRDKECRDASNRALIESPFIDLIPSRTKELLLDNLGK